MHRHAGPLGSKHKVLKWCQWQHLQDTLKDKFNKVRNTRRASRKDIKAYLKLCAELIDRVKALLLELAAKGVSPQKIDKITNFVMHAVRQIDQIDRRLLKGETIPQNEKVFSIFEPHTRWISKGKAGRVVELGVPVCIIEDQYQFILHHEVMWTGSDVDFAVPIVEITKELFPDFCSVSFDRGFHSPANRTRLDEPCSVERSKGICPKCCFGCRCPERASPRTCAASASAGTTSSRSLRQAKTNSLLQPANCGNQRVFPTMIKPSRNRRSERIGSRS